jgi:hypothetical protein
MKNSLIIISSIIIGLVLYGLFSLHVNLDNSTKQSARVIEESHCGRECSKSEDDIDVEACAFFCFFYLDQDTIIYNYIKNKELLGWEINWIPEEERGESNTMISFKKRDLKVTLSLGRLSGNSLENFFSKQKEPNGHPVYLPFVDLDPIDDTARYKTFIVPGVIATRSTVVDFPEGLIDIRSCYNCPAGTEEEVLVFHNHLVEIAKDLVTFSSDSLHQEIKNNLKRLNLHRIFDFKND